MKYLDLINSIFFFASSIFVWLNVAKLIHDKGIKGVRLSPSVFFSISTIWGMFYYYQIHQHWSLLGITLLAMANTSWMALAVYYEYFWKVKIIR